MHADAVGHDEKDWDSDFAEGSTVIKAQEAKRRAAEFLQLEGSPWVVSRATLNRRFRVWVISYVDPQEPEQPLVGGALVVTEDGVADHLGSAPGSLEELMGELGRLPIDPLAEAWAREGEGLALLADSDPTEAEGLAAWAADQQQRREGTEKWRSDLGEDLLPASWSKHLKGELEQDYWSQLLTFVAAEREEYEVFPPASQTFSAFDFTSYEDVKVVILGQDPYPTPG
ncbi:hypothetical protein [Knoellia aerolata]|uniref:hypothetical protein n=1 Tax=Knoellia aerolata TaxID=442954 RepID=UPI000A6CDB93|nr:hypothetical protein [Knoellia aerolata]